VDLCEGLVKALRRRAEASEGRERWTDAGRDWEALSGKEWVKHGVRREAVRGAGRCRRIATHVQDADVGESRPQVPKRPVPRPPPKAVVSTVPTQALENPRNANDAAEREDQARDELKDMVDEKPGGVETWEGDEYQASAASLKND